MSEITDDYLPDANCHRWTTTAKAAKLSVTSNTTTYAWRLPPMPDEMIDSDLATAEDAGAPTLRAALDDGGVNQIPLHVEDFTPASGGEPTATSEIYVNPGTYADATALPVTLFWITGGSQTQPAAGDTFGSDNVYKVGSTNANLATHDLLNDVSANGTSLVDTNTAAAASPIIGQDSRTFTGGDKIQSDHDMDTASDNFTWMCWLRWATGARYLLAQWETNKGMSIDTASGNCTLFVDLATPIGTLFGEFANGTEYQFAATYDSTDGYVLYKNGSSIGSTGTTTFPDFASATNGFTIGNRFDAARTFLSEVDEVHIIYSTFDAGQISTLYQNLADTAAFWDTTSEVEDGPFAGGSGSVGTFAGLGIGV